MTAAARVMLTNKEKMIRGIELLRASVEEFVSFDTERVYSPKELEPYDALSDRFMRSTETAIQYFRSLRLNDEGTDTETFRDLLLYMHKRDLITDPELWIEMRNLRNRIVHDYLPEQQKEIYADIVSRFSKELFRLVDLIQKNPEKF
jgi:hypothetical protein